MKKYSITTIILLLVIMIGCNRCVFKKSQSEDAFLQELKEFRYSLYPDLYAVDASVLQYPDAVTDAVEDKCAEFCQDHEEEIVRYQKSALDKYRSGKKDLRYFVEDTTYSGDVLDESIAESMISYKRILKIICMDPVVYANFLLTSFLTTSFSVHEISARQLRNIVAQSRIRTYEIEKDVWEIMIDEYEYLYLLRYHLDDHFIDSVKVYRRK